MLNPAVPFLLATVVAAILTPLVRHFAMRWGVLDNANEARKIHGQPIPRLGGIAIAAAFYLTLLAAELYNNALTSVVLGQPPRALGLLAGGVLIAALGVYDDVRGSGATRKFTVQLGVGAFVYFMGFRIDQITNPFGGPLNLGSLGLPFTLLWVVGVINAMNLIDGLDGLAGGVGLIAVVTNFLLALERGDHLMMLVSAAFGGAILGFLFYNFHPASIFMGDTGSMFLGFVLATTAIQTNQKASTTVTLLTPIVMLGLPIFDTLLAIARRAADGQPLFKADREHIHHRLLGLGLSHRQVTLFLYGVCICLASVALSLSYVNGTQAAALLAAVLGASYLLLLKLGYLGRPRRLPAPKPEDGSPAGQGSR